MATGQATEGASSLQARLEQIGNQIDEAHSVIDRICADGGADKTPDTPVQEGAENGVARCQRGLARLLDRLNNITERVGHL